jgi:hypothetical protein
MNVSSPAVGTEPRSTRPREQSSLRQAGKPGVWEGPFVLGTFLVLAVRLFVLVSRNAVNIFFNDEWDFNDATLFQKHSVWEMFRWQYGPPRLGLGPLVSKIIEPNFHWNSRAESFLATGIVTAAAIAALYLKTRLRGGLRFHDIALPLIFFTPAQFESLWITPNLAHGILPILLIVVYCLGLTCESAVLRYALVLAINFAAIYTGFALFIGLITPVWILLDYYSRRHTGQKANWVFVCLLISLLSLGSFFVGYRMDPDADCFSLEPHGLAGYVKFSTLMLAHFFGARGLHPQRALLLGGVLLAAMAFIVVSFGWRFYERKSYTAADLVPAVLAAFGLIFCFATAYGRSCFGSYVAYSSRYTGYVELGILGLYLYTLGIGRTWLRTALPVVLAGMLVWGALPVTAEDQYGMNEYYQGKAEWRKCYLKTEDVHGCDVAVHFAVYPLAERTGLKEKLQYLKRTKQNLYSDSP